MCHPTTDDYKDADREENDDDKELLTATMERVMRNQEEYEDTKPGFNIVPETTTDIAPDKKYRHNNKFRARDNDDRHAGHNNKSRDRHNDKSCARHNDKH